MEILFGGLGVTALVGLTFLAYKHPRGFKKIGSVIRITWLAYFLGLGSWSLAVSRSQSSLIDACYGQFSDSLQASGFHYTVPCSMLVHQMPQPTLLWWVLPMLFGLYVWFLEGLPDLLKEDEEQSSKPPEGSAES